MLRKARVRLIRPRPSRRSPLSLGEWKAQRDRSSRAASSLPQLAPAIAVGLSIVLNGAFLATDTSAGEMSFWSSKEDDDALARLAGLPSAPLFLYGVDQNLFIRSRRVPPGGLYSNPDLWVHYLVGGLEEEQVRILRDHPETIVLRGSGTPLETPGRLLPAFLESHHFAEDFGAEGIRRLRPR